MTYYVQKPQGSQRISKWQYRAALLDGARIVMYNEHHTVINKV